MGCIWGSFHVSRAERYPYFVYRERGDKRTDANLRCYYRATIFNDRDQSTNQIGIYNVTTPVTAIALTPGTLILTIVGNRFLQTSKLTFALTNKAGIITQADESSIQSSSPNAYCDSNNTYTGDTRLVNCYFFTNPSVTLGKSRLHVSQSFQCNTALSSGRCLDSSSPSQVTLSLYNHASQTSLVSGPGKQVTGKNFLVTVSVTNPLSTESSMDFTYHSLASGRNRDFWTTSTNPSGWAFCQQVAIQVSGQKGQREFDCYFAPNGV